MRRMNRMWTAVAIAAAAGWLFTAPASAAQRQGGGGRPTSSRPPSGGGGGGGGTARPSGGSSGGGSGGGQAGPRAVPRDAGGGSSGSNGTSSGSSGRPTSNRPPTAGAPVGRAVQPAGGGGGTVLVPDGYYGGFYPWGYAGLGFGGYFAGYYGYYDPWFYDDYYAPPYIPIGDDEGTLRLKVKPRDAMVYIDGYYAGRVDDFDGIFQRLHVDPGPHRLEIRADGYEPLIVDIDVRRNRSMTYSGEMKRSE